VGGLGTAGDLLGRLAALATDPAVGFGVQLAVAAIFLAAGVHKLRRPGHSAEAVARFGLPRLAGKGYVRLLGGVETLVAMAIVAPPMARAGAVACAVLATTFTVLTARAYWRGDRFACSCLSASSEPISRLTVARAAALLVAAAVVAVLPGTTTVPDRPALLAAVALAAALVGVPLAVVTWQRCRLLTARYVARIDWDGLAVNWANQRGGVG
jgi:uncharacterized membrane protein YphA (DoxX/SURF4 family)